MTNSAEAKESANGTETASESPGKVSPNPDSVQGEIKSTETSEASQSASSLWHQFSAILTPTTWIAAIAAFVGFTGLVFNASLALFVGTKLGNYSSVSEHLGAGAGMITPTIIYAADILVSLVFMAFVAVVVIFATMLFARLLLYLHYLLRRGHALF